MNVREQNINHNDKNLLEVRKLLKYFPVHQNLFSKSKEFIAAVDNVSFAIPRSTTFGLVGESGSGKSTVSKCLVRALDVDSGEIILNINERSLNISKMSQKSLRPLRRHLQMVFQDPYNSLNPRMRVRDIVSEPLLLHKTGTKSTINNRVAELLDSVGLDCHLMNRFPHALSGGQRQRVSIARALALNPELIICDEPVSALDVSVQAQILKLFQDIQKRYGTGYLFISHDLRVVEHIADHIAVMYRGSFIETGPASSLYSHPRHPYTEALLKAANLTDWEHAKIKNKKSQNNKGCKYAKCCQYAEKMCYEIRPEIRELDNRCTVQCHFADSLSLKGINQEG